jgi:hypothetical protein
MEALEMAQNTTKDVAAATWVLLTDTDILAATFQNNGSNAVFIAGTADATEPTNTLGAIRYNPGAGERSSVAIADLFPGVTAPVRLFAYAPSGGQVFISHA